MIVKPVEDFKSRRRGLTLELQIRVDDLVARMRDMAPYLCELPAAGQDMVLNLNDEVRLRFVLSVRTKRLYVMLEEAIA